MDHQNQIIEKLAKRIVDLGLQTPAIIFLELHKPISTIFYQSSIFFQPIAAPLFGMERYSNIQSIISNRENIDKLIALIETMSSNKSSSLNVETK